jgi:hypothetical protein
LKKALFFLSFFTLCSGLVLAADNTESNAINTTANTQGNQTSVKQKTKTEKYTFTLFNFFSGQEKSKSDSTAVKPANKDAQGILKD